MTKIVIAAGGTLILLLAVLVGLVTHDEIEQQNSGCGTTTTAVSAPIAGQITVAQANIPTRSGPGGFRAVMHRLLGTSPDLITLNEQSARSLTEIEKVAQEESKDHAAYSGYRDPSHGPGEASQALDTVVLWKSSVWGQTSAGRTQLVTDDVIHYNGVKHWNRYATYALLKRKSDGASASIVSVHQMTNPGLYGPNKPLRQAKYGLGMDTLTSLLNELSTRGPVFVGGDFNVLPGKGPGPRQNGDDPWAAPTKMSKDGFAWFNNGVDYIFYQRDAGPKLVGHWQGPTAEPDHRWIAARFDMNGGASASGTTENAAATGAQTMQLKNQGLTLGQEQLSNAWTIIDRAKVAFPGDTESAQKTQADAEVVAIATALQESKLRNLDYGDRDSLGLFQQRPSQGWGTPAQIRTPAYAADQFYSHLKRVIGWEHMAVTDAAQAVQRSGFPSAYAAWEADARTIVEHRTGIATAAYEGGGCSDYTNAGFVDTGTYVFPLASDAGYLDLHNYGSRGSHWASAHTGNDYSVGCGTPVRAVHAGVVQLDPTSWGGPNMIVIRGNGVTTVYAHLESKSVSNGEPVVAGQPIGKVGAMGNATGCHLHLEVRDLGLKPDGPGHTSPGTLAGSVDPDRWFADKNPTKAS